MSPTVECDVLVVGGGPVGLSAAIGLRHFGLSCTVVERHDATLNFPRGRGVTVRTMEILRQWRLDTDVASVGLPRDESLFVFGGDSLLAANFTRSGLPMGNDLALSPVQRIICDQQQMEVVLRKAALDRGADVRFGTECHRWTADDDGVTATLTTTTPSSTSTVRARWLVAADGARSGVREALGIQRTGPGTLSQSISILFEADLGRRMAGRLSGMYRLGDLPGGAVLSVDNDRRWLLVYTPDPDAEPAATIRPERCLELARAAVGDPSVPVSVVASRVWESTVLVADRYRVGRVLLAGDAAHVVAPLGGLGMNCGIADAHNLAWKLAGVRAGWAPTAIVDSYEDERRPVALDTGAASLGPARPPAPVNGIVLGSRYVSSIVMADRSFEPPAADPVNDYEPAAAPGLRAPHAWLDDSESVSTLDLFGSTFVLLTSDVSPVEQAAIDRVVDNSTTPCEHHPLRHSRLADLYGLRSGDLVLVRPDGYIAWRTDAAVGDAVAELDTALSVAAGGRGPAAAP